MTDLLERGSNSGNTTGHVGALTLDSEKEFKDFFDSPGDEIEGFFCCRFESRPYNF